MGVNYYFPQRNKNKDRLWITCDYLLINLWRADSARAIGLVHNGSYRGTLRTGIPH